eukprot:CAMPEP_0177641122 /NCGR_PEP_ID=MMETSP0447-20121125/6903_1 /TAXON_ID=0 /ORGANISM="Stygamoeba regulata, Strain BSH-02190019" /LENGTH=675 /DNA_ID=CAMNT_0019143229 /DNA_START=14 /DNA_END=2042 /DNA_ORIENTATION=+
MTKHTTELQKVLFKEFVSRICEDDQTVPIPHDQYEYYEREEAGKQYKIHCRRPLLKSSASASTSAAAEEQVILDENLLAKDLEFYTVGCFEVSPDHKLLAYSEDTNGSESYTLRIKDLESGQLLDDQIVKCAAVGGAATRVTQLDELHQPAYLFRHTLGRPVSDDEQLYHETDSEFEVELHATLSGKYIVVSSCNAITTETFFLDAHDPKAELRAIHPRQKGLMAELSAHHSDVGAFAAVLGEAALSDPLWSNGVFVLNTDADEATNFKLMLAPVNDPSRHNWRTLLEYDAGRRVRNARIYANHMVVLTRENGLVQVYIFDLFKKQEPFTFETAKKLSFKEPTYVVKRTPWFEFNSDVFRMQYNSLVRPPTYIDVNMNDLSESVRKMEEVRGGKFDPDNYCSERLWVPASSPSSDGKTVQIPVSLVYRKDNFKKDGTSPFLLYALSLLDRGFGFAIAHVRGGGTLGRSWYEDGKYLHKKNTFTDCIDVAEYLIEQQYTSTPRLAVLGRSAGGLTMGAVLNMRPDLFQLVVADVPFVDVINTMHDPSIPLTVMEYEEWGNPNNKEFHDYMYSYSPYDQLSADKNYPIVLIQGGLEDRRVHYWEPTKFAAKLRYLMTERAAAGKPIRVHSSETPYHILMKMQMGAGHFSKSGRYDTLEEDAFEYSVIIDALKVKLTD